MPLVAKKSRNLRRRRNAGGFVVIRQEDQPGLQKQFGLFWFDRDEEEQGNLKLVFIKILQRIGNIAICTAILQYIAVAPDGNSIGK